MAPGKIYTAKEAFHAVGPGGEEITVTSGQRVREGHWLLGGRLNLFDEDAVDYEYEVATAEPGQPRGAEAVAPAASTAPAGRKASTKKP